MTLADIVKALGCSKGTASRLRAGTYQARSGDLLQRYQALTGESAQPRITRHTDAQRHRRQVLEQICRECPRTSCTGCRIAEIDP